MLTLYFLAMTDKGTLKSLKPTRANTDPCGKPFVGGTVMEEVELHCLTSVSEVRHQLSPGNPCDATFCFQLVQKLLVVDGVESNAEIQHKSVGHTVIDLLLSGHD